MLSASQTVRQEREQPPSGHMSASCALFEPAESKAGQRRCWLWHGGRAPAAATSGRHEERLMAVACGACLEVVRHHLRETCAGGGAR
jgi:hypothetical protein